MDAAERFVRIGDLGSGGDILTLVCRDADPAWMGNWQRQPADELRLLFAQRRGPGVVRPRVIVSRQGARKITPPVPCREGVEFDRWRAPPGHDPFDALGKVGLVDPT